MTISRRKFLGTTAAGLTTAMLGGVSNSARAQATEDTISIAFAARSSNGLNPQSPSLNGADNWMVVQIFDRLVKHPDGGWATKPEEFQPALAESWTSSQDAKTWTYKLRKGVKFHENYGELTTDDVLFTFRRHLDPKINTLSKIFYKNIESVESPDASTIVIKLKQPDPLFNGTCVSHQSASILCKKAFEERGEGFNANPVGTGPFQFESMDTASGLKLIAFPDYFEGKAKTANLHVRYIADTTARTLAFASGDVDMIEGVRAPGWIATMRQQSSTTVFDATAPGSLNTLNINLKKGPLAELKVRQAIRYAIDTSAIAAAFGETSTPMVGIIASQFPGSVREADLPAELQYKSDPEKASALLAEAGFGDGLTIPCYISQREDYASIMLMIQEQLRAVGIQLDMKIIDHATYHSDNRKDKNTLILRSVSYPPVPTQPFADQLLSSSDTVADGSGGENYSHYGTAIPGIDALMEKAIAEPDLDKRLTLVQDMEKQVLKDLPCMGIVTLSYVVARNPRVDIGFKVTAGPAYWPLRHAKRVEG
ncbi:ABC transporter substrate-binding protein [Mesorhizobium sp. YR577]|jgi:peptide/nickel transport system substrate-binding protein|uniref:ABC transporter substrate-binding protein n=1 Tax=Mesorhizobium sp. YR577 TaxID=1884373 RepID=UPI0008F01D41|nr:ABC transporter substrate-binding protein [Mesorhizobium sp. YR577]SFU17194.1 peptide/nickel transport system substrate-binding protein [Mesorhizobium sp. YR577]